MRPVSLWFCVLVLAVCPGLLAQQAPKRGNGPPATAPPTANTKAATAETREADTRAIAGLVGLLLLGVLSYSVWSVRVGSVTPNLPSMDNPESSMTSEVLGGALLGLPEATPKSNLTGLPGNLLPRERTRISYLLPFEIVSVHLLVVLLGAAYLARAKRRRRQA